jgi:hypothetical protein
VKLWKLVRGFLAAVIAAGGLVVAARDEALPQVVHAEMATTLAVPADQVIPWQPWGSVPGAPKLAAGARVTALYRDSSHLDLFVTDATGTVMSTYWEKGGWRPWFPIHPETTAAPGAPVTAVYKDASHLDAFTTDSSGTVISSYWQSDGQSWRPWFALHPETKAAPGAQVTAIYKDASHLDAFTIDGSGAVISSYWQSDGQSWRPWFQIHPETKAAPGAPVAAVYRDATHLDAFATDGSGAVISSYWQSDGQNWRPWFQIHPETKTTPGTQVTARYKDASHIDAFTTDSSGAVISSYWQSDGQSWRPWFQIHPETKVAPKTPVAAVYRDASHLDLFVVGADGDLKTTFWDSQEKIQRIPVTAATCTRFFRQWRDGYENDTLMASCSAFMGLDDWCARHNSFVMVTSDRIITGDPRGNSRALFCVPVPTSDSAIDQVREISEGVAEGLADSFVAAAPYLSIATQGYACIDGVVFACATLALDLADKAGAPVPDVAPEAVAAAKQATDCADGDVVACAQLGTRTVNAAGVSLPIPGLDPGEVADNTQKCLNDDSFLACLRLGKSATDAAGIPGGPGAIADLNDCGSGDTGACTNLGRTVAGIAKFNLNDMLDQIDNADKCKNTSGTDGSNACLALGRAVAASVVHR